MSFRSFSQGDILRFETLRSMGVESLRIKLNSRWQSVLLLLQEKRGQVTTYHLHGNKKKNSRAMNEIPSNRSKICCPLRPHFERKMFPIIINEWNFALLIAYSFYSPWSEFCFLFSRFFFLRSGSAIRFGFFVDFYLLLSNFSKLPSSRFRPHYFPSIDFRSIIISTVSRDLQQTMTTTA